MNSRAWFLYQGLVTRFGVDTQTLGVALDRMTSDWTSEDVRDVWPRLALIYDLLQPAKD